MEEYIEVGQIVNTYGIKGHLKIVPYTDNIERFEHLETIYIAIKNKLEKHQIEEVKYSKNTVLLKLSSINNMNEAEIFKGCYVKIKKEDRIALPENTYFIADLLGLAVWTTKNRYLGNIEDVFSTGSNDVYVVKSEDGKQVLIPAIEEVVNEVNLKDKKMMITLLKGLIEDDEI